jgi:hypothetical protein
VVIALDRDSVPLQATERDYRVLTACTTAFLAFFAGHRDLFDYDEPEAVSESFTGDVGVTVTITAPHGSELMDSMLEDLDYDEDPPVESVPRPQDVGRNDPCPCGSGKKYKKCHLN